MTSLAIRFVRIFSFPSAGSSVISVSSRSPSVVDVQKRDSTPGSGAFLPSPVGTWSKGIGVS
eukprot:scaffold70771_cov47-Prasinocladus_malaysianus.AAC.1